MATAEELFCKHYYLVATIVSAYFASKYYLALGQKFNLLIPYANPQEGQGTFFFPIGSTSFSWIRSFYAGIGYLLVFGIVYSIGRLLGLLLHLIPSKKLGSKLFQVSAGILSMLVTLFVLQMALTILATIPHGSYTKSS